MSSSQVSVSDDKGSSSTNACPYTTNNTQNLKVYDNFDDMGLSDNLIRGIYSFGFENPSKIQARAIVPMKDGHDILAQSQSGTGKTGAFVIGALSGIDPTLKAPQVLVMCPTRELAQQTERVAKNIGSFMGLKVLSATGGTQVRGDISALKSGVQFIVGTPGRIYDLISRRELHIDNIQYVIMDEADQMLEDLFAEQVKHILNFKFPKNTKLALFSATMPENVLEVANSYLRDPVRVLLPPDEVTLEGIKQYYVDCERDDWKLSVLLDLYQNITINQAIIYVNKRQKAEWLAKNLAQQGFTLEYIHGEMEPIERKKRMEDFRSGTVRVLISTDLLARGIDVQQVSLVINFELPLQKENYIHRIGRSGRFGRKGVSVNLISGDEMNLMMDIEKTYSTKIDILPKDISVLNVAL